MPKVEGKDEPKGEEKKEEEKQAPVEEKKKQFTSLKVMVGQGKVFEDIDNGRIVYSILKDRLKGEGEEF